MNGNYFTSFNDELVLKLIGYQRNFTGFQPVNIDDGVKLNAFVTYKISVCLV